MLASVCLSLKSAWLGDRPQWESGGCAQGRCTQGECASAFGDCTSRVRATPQVRGNYSQKDIVSVPVRVRGTYMGASHLNWRNISQRSTYHVRRKPSHSGHGSYPSHYVDSSRLDDDNPDAKSGTTHSRAYLGYIHWGCMYTLHSGESEPLFMLFHVWRRPSPSLGHIQFFRHSHGRSVCGIQCTRTNGILELVSRFLGSAGVRPPTRPHDVTGPPSECLAGIQLSRARLQHSRISLYALYPREPGAGATPVFGLPDALTGPGGSTRHGIHPRGAQDTRCALCQLLQREQRARS